MSLHIFGAVVTYPGVAANNRGETEGNITTLQKLLWNGEVHTTISAEAIRWAIRYYRQSLGAELNRKWNEARNDNEWTDLNYQAWDPIAPKGMPYWDDDVLGFMDAAAGSEESELRFEIPRRTKELQEAVQKKPNDQKAKKKLKDFEAAIERLAAARKRFSEALELGQDEDVGKLQKEIDKERKKAGLKAKALVRRGVLEIARALSTIPFAGEITFNARSGEKDRRSLYGTEIHATRYQYGFALTPERLKVQARAIEAIEAISNLGVVAGNHSRFLFDFSPESIVLRVTDDPAPRLLYCFQEDESRNISAPSLVRKVDNGDIAGSELYIGGLYAESREAARLEGAKLYPGVKAAVRDFARLLKQRIAE